MTADTGPLTLEEAAERLGVHYMTAYRYVRTGRLAATKVDRRWVVDPADLAALGDETEPVPGDTDGHPPTGGGHGEGRTRASGSGRGGGRGRAAYPGRLESRLLAGDEAGSWTLVDQAMAGGMEPADVLLDLVGPAMAAIGRGWASSTVSVAEEHQATATASRLVARLGTRFATRGPARGTVLLGAAPGDHHALPTAILRDLLRGRHLAVIDLGGDVPVGSWDQAASTAAASSPPLVGVGICASWPIPDADLAAAVAAVRARTDAPVVLGGAGIRDGAHAAGLGADHHSTSTRDALDLLDPSTS